MADNDQCKYANKTLPEIKQILRDRKLKVSGKKNDLVDRLLFDDRVSTRDEPQPEYHMALPDASLYKDLHDGMRPDFPSITAERMEQYICCYKKEVDAKIADLYKERYLRYIRTTTIGCTTYATAVMWAEMRRSTSYKVDITLNKDGVVQEAQCECAVGQGPSAHCKHVACALHGLAVFVSGGELLTEVTCTQVLQTFHKAKPNTGSPLKARALSEIRGKVTPLLYDPRPQTRRDPDAAEYLLRTVAMNYQLSSVSDHDVRIIEEATRGQASSSSWKDERWKRITASNFGTVCKCTTRRDMNKLLSQMMSNSDISSKAIIHGRKYESVAVKRFEETMSSVTRECGLFISKTHPMLGATPDRVIDDDTILEVKLPII